MSAVRCGPTREACRRAGCRRLRSRGSQEPLELKSGASRTRLWRPLPQSAPPTAPCRADVWSNAAPPANKLAVRKTVHPRSSPTTLRAKRTGRFSADADWLASWLSDGPLGERIRIHPSSATYLPAISCSFFGLTTTERPGFGTRRAVTCSTGGPNVGVRSRP